MQLFMSTEEFISAVTVSGRNDRISALHLSENAATQKLIATTLPFLTALKWLMHGQGLVLFK